MKPLIKIVFLLCGCLLLFSCTKEDNIIEEPILDKITEPIPVDIQVGMLYAESHDFKNDQCIFKIYFGKNPTEEVYNSFDNKYIQVLFYNREGQVITTTTAHAEAYTPYKVGDTFSLPCLCCEQCYKIKIIVRPSIDGIPTTYEQDYKSVHNFYNLSEEVESK